jgi:hypothetical protein
MVGWSFAGRVSEAFLYRRLETLESARGRYRLNADLAIPFDGFGRLEVDLWWDDSRARTSQGISAL